MPLLTATPDHVQRRAESLGLLLLKHQGVVRTRCLVEAQASINQGDYADAAHQVRLAARADPIFADPLFTLAAGLQRLVTA
jgi:hypothetical protein